MNDSFWSHPVYPVLDFKDCPVEGNNVVECDRPLALLLWRTLLYLGDQLKRPALGLLVRQVIPKEGTEPLPVPAIVQIKGQAMSAFGVFDMVARLGRPWGRVKGGSTDPASASPTAARG